MSTEMSKPFTVVFKGTSDQLEKALGDIKRSMKSTEGTIADSSKAMSNRMDGVTAAAKKTSVSFSDISRRVGVGFTALGGSVVGAFSLAAGAATTFGGSMAKVASLGVNDLGKLRQGAIAAAKSVGSDLNDSAGALYEILSAGVPEGNAIEFLNEASKAAVAGVTNVNTSVDLGTSLVNAFGITAKQAFDESFQAAKAGKTTIEELSASVGQLAPTAAAAGLKSREMLGAVAALTLQGIKTSEAMTGMKAVLSNIIKPTSDATKMAQKLGLDFSITALHTKGLAGFMNDLKQKTGGNIDTMGQLFGSTEALGAALALTGKGSNAFKSTMEGMNNTAGETNKAFELIKQNDPGFQFRQMKTEMQALAVDVGTAVLPVLKQLADQLAPIVRSVSEWMKAHPELTANILQTNLAIGGFMVVAGPVLMGLSGLKSAAGLVGGAFSLLRGGAAAAAPAVSAIGPAATTAATAVEGIGVSAVALPAAVTAAGVAVTAGLLKIASKEKESYRELSDTKIALGKTVARAHEQFAKDQSKAYIQAAIDVVNADKSATSTIGVMWGGFMEGLKDTVKAVVSGIWDMFKGLWESIKGMFGGSAAPSQGGYASGGVVHRAGVYDVGEHGRERVYLPKGAYVANNAQTRAMDGGTVNINAPVVSIARVDASSPADVTKLTQTISREFNNMLNAKFRARGIGLNYT